MAAAVQRVPELGYIAAGGLAQGRRLCVTTNDALLPPCPDTHLGICCGSYVLHKVLVF